MEKENRGWIAMTLAQTERKDLQAALLTIKETAKSVSKRNKLLKISIRTEDGEFALRLNRLIKMYECYLAPQYTRTSSTLPQSHNEWMTRMKPIQQEAEKFILDRLSCIKPFWQIIAENNGWEKVR